MNDNGDLRFGLVGYGLFGKHHARAIAATQGAQLTAIAARSEATRQQAKADHSDAAVLDDYRHLIACDDVDVVDVVAPNHLHYEITRAALEAGRHVFVEKPLATQADHCDELVALASSKGLVLAVNHELRLSSLWGGVKRLIEEGKIGEPRYAMIDLLRFPYRPGSEGWRYDLARVGNWILEEPIHFFDLAAWYLGDAGGPRTVYARASARSDDRPQLQDNFTAVVDFPHGYAVVSQTLAAFGHHVSARVTGTEGAIWAAWSAADARDDQPHFFLRWGLGDEIHEMPFEQMTGELVELQQHVAAFADAARDGTPPPCTGEDGRLSARLCLAAQQSVDTAKPVSMT